MYVVLIQILIHVYGLYPILTDQCLSIQQVISGVSSINDRDEDELTAMMYGIPSRMGTAASMAYRSQRYVGVTPTSNVSHTDFLNWNVSSMSIKRAFSQRGVRLSLDTLLLILDTRKSIFFVYNAMGWKGLDTQFTPNVYILTPNSEILVKAPMSKTVSQILPQVKMFIDTDFI